MAGLTRIAAACLALLFLLCPAGAEQPKGAPGKQKAAGQSAAGTAAERFVDNGDGTVLDKNTGLMWLKDANVSRTPIPWQFTEEFLQEMNAGTRENFGQTDWRLPTADELSTLIDLSRSSPALPAGHPFANVENNYYWSSTSGVDLVDYAWIVDMTSGDKTIDYVSFCNFRYIWPVRSTWTSPAELTGTVLASGLNEHGQLGDGSVEDRVEFMPVSDLADVSRVEAGMEHALVVTAEGTVFGWGRNIEGQLGIGTTVDSPTPTLVKGLWSVVGLSAGMYHSVALKADGTVWTWGRNSDGQLGNATFDDSLLPVQVKDLAEIVAVAAGMYHSVAVRADGTVWTWGRNTYGQLGDGTTKNRNIPVKVKNLTGVKAVSAGLHHTVALKNDGTVWTWGWNMYGLLGDGTNDDRHSPVQVKGLSHIAALAAGLHHTAALKSDGTVWAWGGNEYSQLGISSTIKTSGAIMVEGISGGIRRISSGMYHTVALAADGTVWVWGKDQKDRMEKSPPVMLKDAKGIMGVSAGKFTTYALSGGAKKNGAKKDEAQ